MLYRRTFLQLAIGAAALPGTSRLSSARADPTRYVRIVVPFAASGGNDIHARLFAQELSERLGQNFVVDNRPGASGTIGTAEVVRSPPDGHTLLSMSVGLAVSAAFYGNRTYDLVRDIAPVATFYRSGYLMLVHPSLPVKTVPQFVAYAKPSSATVNMGSSGVGGTGHLAGEWFKAMTGVNMLHVPYRGEGPAVADLVAGQVHVVFASATVSLQLVRSGQLRALAVTSTARWPTIPDIPTLSEFLPGYEFDSWAGIGAPSKTPPAVIDRLNNAVNAALDTERIKARYAALDGRPFVTSPTQFGEFLARDVQKWASVIKMAGIMPT